MTKTFRLPVAQCAWCGYKVDSATDVDKGEDGYRAPEVDDVTICLMCGEWNTFTEPMPSLRKPTDEEFAYIAGDKDCQHMRWAWVQMDADRDP